MATEAVWFDSKVKATAFLNSVFSGPPSATTFSHYEYDNEGRAAAILYNLDADGDYRVDDYSNCSTLPEEVANLLKNNLRKCA